MPYRDTFDHKTPGVYAQHALAMILPGPPLVMFRAFEIAWALALGLLCAWLTALPHRAPRPGVRGVAVLTVVLLVFGCLDYWNTGQGELACVTLATAGIVLARRTPRVYFAARRAGLAGGLALLMKPTALPLLAIAAFILARRVDGARRAAPLLGTFALALLAPIGFVAAYFEAKGALPASLDILVGANRVYVTNEPYAHDLGALERMCGVGFRHFAPLSSVIVAVALGGLALSRLRACRHERANHVLAVAMMLAGLATVAVQRKFFPYHWTLIAGGAAFAMANATLLLQRVLRERRAAALMVPVVGGVLILTFLCVGVPFHVWRTNALAGARALSGSVPAVAERTQGQSDHEEFEQVAGWIRERTSADDTIVVRGAGTEIYLLSDRHAPGRFFWSLFLSSPVRAYRRAEWLAEDLASIERNPPRYVVVATAATSGLDSAAWFAPLGYRTECAFGRWSILSRPRPDCGDEVAGGGTRSSTCCTGDGVPASWDVSSTR